MYRNRYREGDRERRRKGRLRDLDVDQDFLGDINMLLLESVDGFAHLLGRVGRVFVRMSELRNGAEDFAHYVEGIEEKSKM